MLKVLMFLINKFQTREAMLHCDEEQLTIELEEAGFLKGEIDHAFDWLSGIEKYHGGFADSVKVSSDTVRVFDSIELEVLDAKCRGFLSHLEQCKIIDPVSREFVIDRLLALPNDKITVSDVQWVTLMVLFNLPDKKPELTAMQDYVLCSTDNKMH